MADHGWIGPALAANRSTPPDVLAELAETLDLDIQLTVIRSRIGRPSLEPVAGILADSPHPDVRIELARATFVPDEVLVRLAGDPIRQVRWQVIWRPTEVAGVPEGRSYVPAEAYAVLARDDDEVTQLELLGSEEAPVHVKREVGRRNAKLRDRVLLAFGEEGEARAAYERLLTAGNDEQRRRALESDRFRPPAEQVPRLLADEPHRLPAIERIPLDDELARALVADDDPKVRRAVAVNPDLSRELMEILAADPDRYVRKALTERPYVPFDLLEQIDYEPEPEAYRVAWLWDRQHDMALVAEYSWSRNRSYRQTVAQVRGLPREIVERLARDEDYKVRMFLTALNGEHVPIPVLEEMVLTWTGHSSSEMARNPRLPAEFIDRLTRSDDTHHRRLASYTGRLTEEQRARLAADPDEDLAARMKPPPTVEQLRARLASPSPEMRDAAARRPELPADLIRQLWASR
ncbi:hypothetical protein [Paractinoplanes durhamensis]|uniref:Leucine rich repeat variant n=1 Tax=Paractinoplanes durhamensis TaxID=113563 RepID=A0ABQ3Z8Q2_9ACTN|nr:hypothetical protein [Actinoplanes durhamensis]GIE06208.1 hypothetical protein Adu01nite_75580 [Actinoplanes durhamensis]